MTIERPLSVCLELCSGDGCLRLVPQGISFCRHCWCALTPELRIAVNATHWSGDGRDADYDGRAAAVAHASAFLARKGQAQT